MMPHATILATSSVVQARRQSYWWGMLTLLAVVLSVVAYLHPYQPLALSDLPAKVIASAAALDPAFGPPISRSFKYASRRTYSSASGPIEVEIRVTLQPMGQGLVMRQDDWYDLGGKSVVYQERYILFRNLFAMHTRSREVAPLASDLLGRVGWYNDSVEALSSQLEGSTPTVPDWRMDVTMNRISETDGKGLTRQITRYERTQHCERTGEVQGSAVGTTFTGNYAKISCQTKGGEQQAERTSDYAWLPEHGIFLLLGYQQKPGSQDSSASKLDVKANYTSFGAVP